MRRISILLAVVLLAAAAAPVAAAGKPSNTCGDAASGYFVVDVDEWWAITVDGFLAAGLTVYETDGVTYTDEFNDFAAAAGFGNGAGLEAFVRVEQWAGIDHNANGLVCMKRRPITPGNPSYFFNGVDDQSSSPGGDVR